MWNEFSTDSYSVWFHAIREDAIPKNVIVRRSKGMFFYDVMPKVV